MTTPVPGPPPSVLSAIIREDPAHPYTEDQYRLASFSPTAMPVLPSLRTDEVFMPQFAFLDANIEIGGNLTVDGTTTIPGLTGGTGWINVTAAPYNADPTGTTDSTAAIQTAIAAVPSGGGVVYLPAGTFLLNSPSALALATAGSKLIGAGTGATALKTGASFSAAQVVAITADFCAVADLSIVGSSSTVASNPVANGIEITGSQRCKVRDVFCQYINGWAIEAAGSASRGCLDLMITRPLIRNCAGGIHCLGVTGSSFLGEYFLTDLQMQQIGTTTGGSSGLDALLIEDITDVLVQGVNIGTASSTLGGAIHIKGACATVKISNPDVGCNNISGAASAIHIESGSNGTPGDIGISNGAAEGGTNCILVDAGTDILLQGVRAHQAYTTGLVVNAGEVLAVGCSMAANNQAGATGYDIDTSGMSTGNARFIGCRTESTVGTSTPGQVTNPVATSTHAYYYQCFFIASNNTPSTVFTGTPQIVKQCVGYNPRANITAPTITASPFSSNTSQQDVLIIFTAVNSLTAFKIGGTAVGVLPVTGQAYFVPARSSLELDYSAGAPTWQWYGC